MVEKNNELRWFELSIAPMKKQMNMTPILFALLYYKSQTYWSVTAEKWGEVSRIIR
jgi:hypothetical protein